VCQIVEQLSTYTSNFRWQLPPRHAPIPHSPVSTNPFKATPTHALMHSLQINIAVFFSYFFLPQSWDEKTGKKLLARLRSSSSFSSGCCCTKISFFTYWNVNGNVRQLENDNDDFSLAPNCNFHVCTSFFFFFFPFFHFFFFSSFLVLASICLKCFVPNDLASGVFFFIPFSHRHRQTHSPTHSR